MKTVKLNRYAARENNGSVVKGEFVGGDLYRYDADGYVLCREDIDEQGNVMNNLDRKVLYDSADRLVESSFSGTATYTEILRIEVMSAFLRLLLCKYKQRTCDKKQGKAQ